MRNTFREKAVIITGASSGIGFAEPGNQPDANIGGIGA